MSVGREVAILLFDRLTALDAIGPYEVLSRMSGAEVRFVAAEKGLKRTDRGVLALEAEWNLEEVGSPSIVVVPGGPGQTELMSDERVLEWLRAVHPGTRWTTSVCTGSLVLAGAGLLKGIPATSHWLAMEELGRLGAVPVAERVVFAGKIVTAAGVSAGIDMALRLVAREAGEQEAREIQLMIEYDPQPPFDSGSPGAAFPETVTKLRKRSRFGRN